MHSPRLSTRWTRLIEKLGRFRLISFYFIFSTFFSTFSTFFLQFPFPSFSTLFNLCAYRSRKRMLVRTLPPRRMFRRNQQLALRLPVRLDRAHLQHQHQRVQLFTLPRRFSLHRFTPKVFMHLFTRIHGCTLPRRDWRVLVATLFAWWPMFWLFGQLHGGLHTNFENFV